MNEEFRSFRIMLVPLALFIAFFIYKRCGSKPEVPPQQAAPTLTAPSATAPASGLGLQIEGSAKRPVETRSSQFPPGLDAARIQYLVEIDSQFSSTSIAKLPKKFVPTDPVTPILIKMRFAEKNDDVITLTREGLLGLGQLTELPDGWTFETARRVFDEVNFIDRVEDDKYRATFRWHWQPNNVGTELGIKSSQNYSSTAEFGGGERHWALTGWVVSPSEAKPSS